MDSKLSVGRKGAASDPPRPGSFSPPDAGQNKDCLGPALKHAFPEQRISYQSLSA